MRAVLFVLKLGLKIIAAPVVLALALFTWICFGLLYVSSFIFGLASTLVALLGIAVLVTYSPQNFSDEISMKVKSTHIKGI